MVAAGGGGGERWRGRSGGGTRTSREERSKMIMEVEGMEIGGAGGRIHSTGRQGVRKMEGV